MTPKVIVVMPAYNAEKTLARTVGDIPPGTADSIILVDDCSRDQTVAIAQQMGLRVIQHEANQGYGGNQKTCYREALAGGMPFYKYIANRFLTVVENLSMGQNLGEWHSGMRAYSRKVLETIPWEKNSNDFVFDCEFLVQAAAMGFRLGDIPVPARYFEEASSINFKRSLRYGLESVKTIMRYYLHRWKLWPSSLFVPR